MRRNVLVVDDDAHTRDLVKFFLEQSGFQVRICSDGYGALDELQTNSYDLMILDISMPHMNGFKTLKSVRANPLTQDLPVIMLTGSQDRSDVLRAKAGKITDYVIKPPVREDFLKRVELVLGGRPQYEELRFSEGDLQATGSLLFPFEIKSMSKNGLILTGDVFLNKGVSLQIQDLKVISDLDIDMSKLKVTECTPNDSGRFDYYISFLGMKKSDQDKLNEFIVSETFKKRNLGQKAS